MTTLFYDYRNQFFAIAQKAALAILSAKKEGTVVQQKADASPVTQADLAANQVITDGLIQLGQQASVQIPIISEESENIPWAIRKNWTTCWMVDPLDGTREFIAGSSEYTINIALIHNGAPVAGLVMVPETDLYYFGAQGYGSFKFQGKNLPSEISDHWHPIFGKETNSTKIVLRSRFHFDVATQNFIEAISTAIPGITQKTMGSSLKFCEIASGAASVYPKFGTTMEWDTAAGDAICRSAGCAVLNSQTGQLLRYNRSDLTNPHFLALTPTFRNLYEHLQIESSATT
jgi:3'(2'), 5'-bisphosphate nucleotidase